LPCHAYGGDVALRKGRGRGLDIVYFVDLDILESQSLVIPPSYASGLAERDVG
jgi:hypothetical protein